MSNMALYYTAADIMEMVGVSRGQAYKIIKLMNEQLSKDNYIVIAGKVPKKYFQKRYYGFDTVV